MLMTHNEIARVGTSILPMADLIDGKKKKTREMDSFGSLIARHPPHHLSIKGFFLRQFNEHVIKLSIGSFTYFIT